jgi:hypothetical protein
MTVVWIAILLIVIALLFPPFGYSAYKRYTGVIKVPEAGLSEARFRVSWRYVTHRFIFSDPPKADPRLKEKSSDGLTYSFAEIQDMGIGWHIVGVEIAIIVITAFGIIASLLLRKKA